jgi:tripartite-type tricarboxylate transporter receptor subunit TctC
MTNTLVTSEPRDGTVIGAAINGMPTAPLLEPGSTHFDPAKLTWIGSSDRDVQVAYVWHTAPVQSLKDLAAKQLIVGADAPGTTHYDYPAVGRTILGLKFKIISGYSGTGDIHKAMEAGEVQGVGSSAMASLEAMNPLWVTNGDIKIIGLWNPTQSTTVPANVPLFIDLAKTPADRQAILLMVSRLEYGRPFFAPPGVPADRARALQKAFMETMKDPAFLTDAKRERLDIDPITGDEIEKLVTEVATTPPSVVARLRAGLAHP